MAACTAIVRRTFLELDNIEESNREIFRGRPRADTDSIVDYHRFVEDVDNPSCGCDNLSVCASTVGESSWADCDGASSRCGRWGDLDDSDSELQEACNGDPAEGNLAFSSALPSGCYFGPPGCHVSSPVVFMFLAPHCFNTQKYTRPRKEVTQTSTLVLRRLPEQYACSHVCELLDAQGFSGQYDFIYAPMEFKTSKALRYAIANFTSIATAKNAKEQLDGIAVDDVALEAQFSKTHDGLESLMERYRYSPVMTDPAVPKRHRPLLLANGKAVSFPWPQSVQSV